MAEIYFSIQPRDAAWIFLVHHINLNVTHQNTALTKGKQTATNNHSNRKLFNFSCSFEMAAVLNAYNAFVASHGDTFYRELVDLSPLIEKCNITTPIHLKLSSECTARYPQVSQKKRFATP